MAIRPMTLHGLAEDIWEALDERGFWDDVEPASSRARRGRSGTQRGLAAAVSRSSRTRAKPKRKVSRYQKAFGACLKALKKKHPRTSMRTLMRRAHVCARRKKREGGW